MNISITDPIADSIERTRVMLFSPFDIEKWLHIGLCCWLAHLGRGINVGNPGNPADVLDGPARDWIRDNFPLVAGIVAGIGIISIAVVVLFMWLNSRGLFMFLNGFVHNSNDIAAPWQEYRPEANSLFRFRLIVSTIEFAVLALAIATCTLIALDDFRSRELMLTGKIAIGLCSVAVLASLIIHGVINVTINDFIVPLMYVERIPAVAGCHMFINQLVAENKESMALYYLMRLVITMGTGIIAALITCCGFCCIMWIPYLNTVFLLPLFVFKRGYSLFFLAQFNGRWDLVSPRLPGADEDDSHPVEPPTNGENPAVSSSNPYSPYGGLD